MELDAAVPNDAEARPSSFRDTQVTSEQGRNPTYGPLESERHQKETAPAEMQVWMQVTGSQRQRPSESLLDLGVSYSHASLQRAELGPSVRASVCASPSSGKLKTYAFAPYCLKFQKITYVFYST